MKRNFSLLLVIAIIFLSSCGSKHHDPSSHELTAPQTLKMLTIVWDESLNNKDTIALDGVYADSVSLYEQRVSKRNVIRNKAKFFGKHPEYKQKIIGDMAFNKMSDQQYKVSFKKSSSFNHHSQEVQAVLIFDKVNDSWKISSESDDISAKNSVKTKDSVDMGEVRTCQDLANVILWTSPSFIKRTKGLNEAIIKNGGTSMGTMLEGSPEGENGSVTEDYEFNLHESYPDRMVVIGRYNYDAKAHELYEYDAAEDTFKKIDFDRSLLIKYANICK